MIAEGGRSLHWVRQALFLAVTAAIAVAACSSDQRQERPGSATQALTTEQQRILGFEFVSTGSPDWTATSGLVSQSSQHVEGAGSLAISNSGNTTITSAALSSLGPVADKLTLDVLLPTVQPNPSWLGTVQLVVECPSQQLWYEALAERPLQGQPLGQFVRFEFPLSASTQQKLSTGSYTDLRFKLLLNVPSGAGPWLVDRLAVGDAGGGSGGSGGTSGGTSGGSEGQAGSSGTSANSPILGFESTTLWTATGATLTASDTHLEGAQAVEASGLGYAEITSNPLTTVDSVGSVVGFDLSVPNPVGDVFWWGSAAISLDCPSRGLYNRWLGQQEIDGSALGRFRRVEVALPDDVKTALTTGTYADLRVKVILNVPQGSGPYVLDHFTFTQQQPDPAPPGPSEAAARALGFETLEAWKSTGATLTLSSSALEGDASLSVSGFTHAEVTSQRLSSMGPQVDSPLQVNVRFPASPNPNWAGSVGLAFDLPSAGIHSMFIAQHELQGLQPDVWHRLTFDLSPGVVAALQGNYSDLRIKFILNWPEQPGAFLFDGLKLKHFLPPSLSSVEEYVLPLPKGVSFTNVAMGQAFVQRSAMPGADLLSPRWPGAITLLAPLAQSANVVAPRMSRSGGDASVHVAAWTGDVSAFLDVLGGPITGTARAGRNVEAVATHSVPGANLESFQAGRIRVEYPAGLENEEDIQATLGPENAYTYDLLPGDYGFVRLTGGNPGTFVFHSGTYHLLGLDVGGEGVVIRADNAQGPVLIHVHDSLELFGDWERTAPEKHNVLLTYAGRDMGLTAMFDGTLVAPRIAQLTRRGSFGDRVVGSFFVRSAQFEDSEHIQFHAFERDDCPSLPAGGCGAFGCDTSDTDADGLYDCEEQQGQWADPEIFNGVHVRAGTSCTTVGADICAGIDTLERVGACPVVQEPILEQNMYAGWSLGGRPLRAIGCQDELSFWPPWSQCTNTTSTSFDYRGFIRLAEGGNHCFALPATSGVCGSLFFNGATQGVTSDSGTRCFDLPAGIYPIRWVIDSPRAATPDRVGVNYCSGGNAPCEPTAAIPQAMLRPGQSDEAPHCSNGVTDGNEWAVDCGPSCSNKNCRAPVTPCQTDADCGPGTFCSPDALEAQGLSVAGAKVCWNDICKSGVAECGSLDETCGRCLCRPTCADKQCGDNLFDGCNGFCDPVCQSGEAGCKSDAECPLDHVCLQDVGAQHGLPADADVCVPSRCLEPGTADEDCGDPADPCGTACNPPAHVSCQGMECGKDPVTKSDCGTCTGLTTCSLDNHCVEPEGGVRLRSRTVSYEVGATPGTYSVSPLGRSTYRIPLRLPEAAHGLTPDLELVFSDSSHMRGLLGPGWTLTGASRVHRCNAPTTQDSFAIRPQEPLPSQLCLDGRPLRRDQALTDQLDDPGETFFKLVDDDASRIIRKSGAATTFEVTKPDGTIYFYGLHASDRRSVRPFEAPNGFDVDSRTPTDSWHLSEIRDRFGNTAQFHYTGTRNGTEPFAVESSFYLTHIDYSGHFAGNTASNTFKRRITFGYQVCPEGEPPIEHPCKVDALGRTGGYFHFVPVDDNRLLESITVDTFDGAEGHAGDRIYRISYRSTPGNGIQRVDSIQECTGYQEVEKCLPSTKFKYDDAPEGDTHRFGTPKTGAIEPGHGFLNYVAERDSKLNQALAFDADGDGFKDVLQVNQDPESLRFWHAEGHSDGSVTFAAPKDIGGPKPSCVSGASIADLDGDGRDEIIDSCPVFRHKQAVNYFSIDASGEITEHDGGVKALTSPYVGDIDGDGRPDIIQETDTRIYFADFSGYASDHTMRFNLNSGVDAKGMASVTGPQKLTRQPFMIDVDGDGTPNLLRFDPPSKQFYALRLAGDEELTDEERSQIGAEGADEAGGFAVFMRRIPRWLPTGLAYQVSPLTGGPGNFDSIRILDINGDGLEDVWVQSEHLIAPLDINLFRVPDVTTGSEPNYSTEVARANRLVGQIYGGGVVEAGPTNLWINVGGAFKPKGAIVSSVYGHAPTSAECDVRTADDKCISRIDNWSFRGATVMDYDNDGRDELLVQLSNGDHLEWHRIWLESETVDRGYLAADLVPDLPNGDGLYIDDIDNNPYTAFHSLPVFADFNGDANVDVLVAGHDDLPANRVLVMGNGRGNGWRLRNVTDGLGNTIDITQTQDRAVVDTTGACGEPEAGNDPRCLRTVPLVVSQVSRGTTRGQDYGQTTYKYAHPTSADFLGGYYFTSRSVAELTSATDGTRAQIAETKENFAQALDNGVFGSKFTYPFLFSPTHRERRLADSPDLEGTERGRTIVDDYVYENLILPEGMPHLAEHTQMVSDETVAGPVQVVRRHDVFDSDSEGFPLVHEQKIYTGPEDEQVERTRVYTAREYDGDRWILGSIDTLEVTSERNGVEKTRTTSFEYDDETGFIEKKTEHVGDAERELVTEYTPDSFGNIASVTQTSADGVRVTSFDYGSRGIYPESVTNAENHVREFQFDDVWGRPTLIEDENNYQIAQRYDGFGRLIRRESHNGDEVTLLAEVSFASVDASYQVDGVEIPAVFRRSVSSELFSGGMTEDYDSRGLRVRSKRPGIATDGQEPYLFGEVIYDWDGKPLRRSAAHADDTAPIWNSAEYDLRGRLIATEAPSGNLQIKYASAPQFGDRFPEWSFSDAIELALVTDDEGKEGITVADQHGEKVVSADGVDVVGGGPGFVSRTVRGAMNLPVLRIDPEQNEITTEYDADGLVASTQDPDRGLTRLFYDAYGNVRRVIAADEVVSEFTYDRINRVKRRIDDGDEAHPTQWTYDVDGSGQPKLGRLTQMVGPTGIRTDLAYEDSPRALGTSITRQVGDEVFTTTTSFDRLGLPIRTEYPSVPRAGADDFAFAVRPIFDPHSGALVAVQSDDATTDYWRISGADEMGRVTEVALGNGLHETYEFDPTSQLLARASVLDEGDHELSSLDYSYFDNGQLHERTLSAGGLARARTIAYDNARRIHTVTESGSNAVNETFNFSPSGRLESRTKFGEYTYDEQHPHALGSVAENEFTYDERGNQKTREGPNVPGGAQTISYNRFNLPSRVAFGIDPEHADRTIDFEYDADGNRIVKREANGGPEVLSLGDEYERTTGGVSAPGVQHKFRIFAAGREVAQVIYDEALAVPEVRYLHRDQQMSVLLTTNADGEANEVRDFDVFGEAVTTPGWADTTKEGFTGHQREVDIGLVSAGARLYDATFGVFISADPLRESFAGSQSFNPYAYTNNDPVNLIDPTGLAAEEPNWWDNPGTWSCPGNGCMCRDPGCGGPQIGYRKIRDTPVNEFIATGGQGEWGGTMTAAELANMPSGLQAPPLRTPNLFAQPEFQVVDTSETLRTELNIAMGVVNLCQLAGTAVAWVSARVFIAEASEILAAEGATLAEGTAVAAEGAPLALPAPTMVNPWAGVSVSTTAAEPLTMFRVWGGEAGQIGSWLTPVSPTSSAAARAALALPEQNAALFVSKVIVPTGTRFQIGTAGAAFGQPGGAVQLQLLERIPASLFGEGVPLP